MGANSSTPVSLLQRQQLQWSKLLPLSDDPIQNQEWLTECGIETLDLNAGEMEALQQAWSSLRGEPVPPLPEEEREKLIKKYLPTFNSVRKISSGELGQLEGYSSRIWKIIATHFFGEYEGYNYHPGEVSHPNGPPGGVGKGKLVGMPFSPKSLSALALLEGNLENFLRIFAVDSDRDTLSTHPDGRTTSLSLFKIAQICCVTGGYKGLLEASVSGSPDQFGTYFLFGKKWKVDSTIGRNYHYLLDTRKFGADPIARKQVSAQLLVCHLVSFLPDSFHDPTRDNDWKHLPGSLDVQTLVCPIRFAPQFVRILSAAGYDFGTRPDEKRANRFIEDIFDTVMQLNSIYVKTSSLPEEGAEQDTKSMMLAAYLSEHLVTDMKIIIDRAIVQNKLADWIYSEGRAVYMDYRLLVLLANNEENKAEQAKYSLDMMKGVLDHITERTGKTAAEQVKDIVAGKLIRVDEPGEPARMYRHVR